MIIECILLASSLCHVVKDKPVMLVAAAGLAASIADTHQTVYLLHRDLDFHERNPLAAPFVAHPSAAYAAAVSFAVVSAMLGHRIKHSQNRILRGMWWVPSTLQFSLGLSGYLYTRTH